MAGIKKTIAALSVSLTSIFALYSCTSAVQEDFVFKYRPQTDAEKEKFNQLFESLYKRQFTSAMSLPGEPLLEEIDCIATNLAIYQYALDKKAGETINPDKVINWRGQFIGQSLAIILSCQMNPGAVPPRVMKPD